MAISRLSRSGWTITADSTAFSLPVGNAIDGNLSTFWHSDSGFPHYLTVDMGSAQTFSAVEFVPRSDGTRTDPAQVAVYVSDDGVTWGSPVATATWVSTSATQYLTFASVTKRWFRFQGNTGANNAYMACTEIYAGDPVINALVTQVAVESLASIPGVSARVTQVAVESLFSAAGASARVTQVAVESLFNLSAPAASIRETQAALEYAGHLPSDSISALLTQAGLEYVQWPPNNVWATQVGLEIAYHGVFGLAVTCPYAISGSVGTPYSSGIGVSGGTGPYIYAITGGSLPPGLTLDTSTGLISGTPTAAGDYRYSVTAVDSTDAAVSTDCSIVICAGAKNYAYIS